VCQCQCPSVANCLCGTTFNTNTCACSAFPTHPCGLTYNTATCSFVIPSCPLSCQTYNQTAGVCACSNPTCLAGQQFFTYSANGFCTCYYVIEHCRVYAQNTNPATSTTFPLLCTICDFLYTPSNNGFNCNNVAYYYVSMYSGSGQAAGSVIGLSWTGYWIYQIGASSTALGTLFLTKQESIDSFYATLQFGYYWQVNFYSSYNFYTIHTNFYDTLGNVLLPPFYISWLNNNLQIIVGFTQNTTINNTSGQNIPTNDLFFSFTNGNYIDATHTLWSICDPSGSLWISPSFTFTNQAARATVGFGVTVGHY